MGKLSKRFISVVFFGILVINWLCFSCSESAIYRKGYCYFIECVCLANVSDYNQGTHANTGNGTLAHQVYYSGDDRILYFSVHGYKNGTIYDRKSVSEAVDTLIDEHNLMYLRSQTDLIVIICCHPEAVGRGVEGINTYHDGTYYSRRYGVPIIILGYRPGMYGIATQGERQAGGKYQPMSNNDYLVEVCFAEPGNDNAQNRIYEDRNVVLPNWTTLIANDVARLENFPLARNGKRRNYCEF